MATQTYAVDWSLDEAHFKDSMEKFITHCAETGLVMPLPLSQGPDTLSAIISQINCDKCNSKCCRSAECNDKTIECLPAETALLSSKYGGEHFTDNHLQMPCPFILGNNQCRIYKDRPLVCVLYPIQPNGGIDGVETISLSSFCPEAKRIAFSFYMAMWQVLNTYHRASGTKWRE